MRKIFLITLILLTVLVSSSSVLAEKTFVFSESSKPVLQAMELSLKSNSLSYLYTFQSEERDLTFRDYSKSDSLKLKNPNTALFYAAVPGFIVHGVGHFYAGKEKTAALLFVTELAGIALVSYSIYLGMGEIESEDTDKDYFVGLSGLILFAGSWMYDMIGAPKVVKKHNELVS
ncbi:MAG: hypothetical protein OEV55_05480 [candidate division Zixibacteria bacterium]|nr:hypothetical protein [candidate division Zixibacteria bacterium]